MKDFLVVWIVPPFIGAVIGLFTNWLAIKMLFRPLREIRFLGVKLPFTPGILPRERFRISKAIGDTVARELLTEDVLRRRLQDPAILYGLGSSISGFLSQLLERSAAQIVRGSGKSEESTTFIASSLDHAFKKLVGSEAFIAALVASMRKFLETVGTLPLSSIVGSASIDSCMSFLLDSEPGASGERILESLVERLYAKRSVRLIPSDVFDPLVRVAAEGLFTACIPVIESYMEEPETRRLLEIQALGIVKKAVGRLNPLQRIVVTAANYEKTVSEAIPATIDDLSRTLSSMLRKDEMRGVIAAKASNFFASGVEEGGGIDFSSIIPRQSARSALAATLSAMRDKRLPVSERLKAAYAERADMSVADLVGDLGVPVDRILAYLASSISSSLASKKVGKTVLEPLFTAFRSELSSRFGGATVGEVLGIDSDTRDQLAKGIAGKVLDLVCQEAGNIIAGLDIRKVVVDRIDELDIVDVERMILDVVNSELVWITIIGGVLGGLIGIVQSIMYALGR